MILIALEFTKNVMDDVIVLDFVLGWSVFDVLQVDSLDNETSGRNPLFPLLFRPSKANY